MGAQGAPPNFYNRMMPGTHDTRSNQQGTWYQVNISKRDPLKSHSYYQYTLLFIFEPSDGSTGGEGGDHPVWRSQMGLRRGDDGVKNIRFFGEICCSRTIFARVFKVEIVLWY